MASPAQRHRERELARARGAATEAGLVVASGAIYDQYLAKLITDMRRLKDIQSTERKIEAKTTIVPEYDDYIDGVLLGGSGAQDEVLATLCIWNIDAGRFARALEIGAYLLTHGIKLPQRYKRDLHTALIDEVADALLLGKVEDPKIAFEIADATDRLTQKFDAPDQARAKLFKVMGGALLSLSCPGVTETETTLLYAQRALEAFERAVQLFPKVGIKKEIEGLQRRLKNNAGSPG
jgi:hypothetical protein